MQVEQAILNANLCHANAGLDVIPDLEVACPADDEAIPAHTPHAAQPPGWEGARLTNGKRPGHMPV